MIASVIDRPVIIGANTVDKAGRIYNSVVVADKDGEIHDIYNKSHLVPFGEYRPLGFLPAPVNLTPGDGPKVISVAGLSVVPAICYEIIFSDSLLSGIDVLPHAIVNVTNDNWFGNTPGVYQHLDMVRRYAIESGLPIVRANYSGISAFIASDGAVVSSLPVGEVGVLDGFVWGAHDTLYRIIGRDGWMVIILCFASVMIFVLGRRK